MVYEIENDRLRVKVRSYGAELTSVFDKKTATEHVWNADPNFWNWHAPVLFPVVGRCWNDNLLIHGDRYKMEKHGFARKSEFELLTHSPNEVVFRLINNPATETGYPFAFEFYIGYRLDGRLLQNFYKVVNPGYGELYFSLGAHPALKVPFNKDENFEDYFIEFSKDTCLQRQMINEDGFFTGEMREVLHGHPRLPLSRNMFDEDALIFKDLHSREVVIGSNKHEQKLRIRFADFPYLGLWSKNGANYVCVEPWLGCADSVDKQVEIEEKEGIIRLTGNRSFEAAFQIIVD
ncbi:MAG: aldose 1-epimerase family protein [Chitinophagales bacterium]